MPPATPELHLFRNEEQFDTYDAEAQIFRSGESGEVMYAVKSGEVDLIVEGTVVETVAAGGVFGEMALIEHEDRSATAIARTACELVPINERRFTFLVQQNPFFAMHVMRVLAARLRRMNVG